MEYFPGILILTLFLLATLGILYFYRKEKYRAALWLILGLGLALRVFLSLEPVIHTWDERYHALVAKHLSEHPLTPTLYDNPPLEAEFKDWGRTELWITKQTAPLWLMAGSLAIFGDDEFFLRLPSILLSLLSIYLSFVLGRELFGKKVGLMAAYLHAIHGLFLELSAGVVSSDHVELFHQLSLQAGIIASIFFLRYKQEKYLLLIGICMAAAFLSKWISGLMIFFVFGALLLQKRLPVRDLCLILLKVLGVFLLLILPWMSYLYVNFPEETSWMLGNVLFPIYEAEGGHQGTVFYYLDEIRMLFGELIYLPLIWMTYRNLRRKKKPEAQRMLLIWIWIPLLLLSMADMKRHTYILVSAPAFFLLIAFFFRFFSMYAYRFSGKKWLLRLLMLLLILLPIRYSVERLKPFKQRWERPQWQMELANFVDAIEGDDKKIVLSSEPHHLEAMYYHAIYAYEYQLTSEQVSSLLADGFRVFKRTEMGYEELH